MGERGGGEEESLFSENLVEGAHTPPVEHTFPHSAPALHGSDTPASMETHASKTSGASQPCQQSQH